MVGTSRLFRWVWRFNAVVIAAAASLAIVLGLAALIALVADVFAPRHVRNVVPSRPLTTAPPQETVGRFSTLGGTSYLWAAINNSAITRGAYLSKRTHSSVDFIVYDPATGASRRILGSSKALLLAADPVRVRQADGRLGAATALLLQIVDQDTTGDGRLSARDLTVIALARPDGSGLKRLDDIKSERLHGWHVRSDGQVVVFASAGGKLTAFHIDPVSQTITARHAIGAVATNAQ